MPFTLHPNAAIGVVAIAPTPPTSGATLTLQPGQGAKFGAPNVRVAIAPPNVDPIALAAAVEFALMTDCTGDVLTLTRATEGPNGARAIQVGDLVYATPTGAVFTDLESVMARLDVPNVFTQPNVFTAPTTGDPAKTYKAFWLALDGHPGRFEFQLYDSGLFVYWYPDFAGDPGNAIECFDIYPDKPGIYAPALLGYGVALNTQNFAALGMSPNQSYSPGALIIIRDSPTQTPGAVISTGGGSYLVLAFLNAASQWVVIGPGDPAAATLPTAALGQALISQGAGVPPIFSSQLALNGPTPQVTLNNPASSGRLYKMGINDPAGTLVLSRSDVAGTLAVTFAATFVELSPSGSSGDFVIASNGGTLVFTPAVGGGARQVQFGRRMADSTPACGAAVEFWPATGQTSPAAAVMAPGGAAYRWGVMADGRAFFGDVTAGIANVPTLQLAEIAFASLPASARGSLANVSDSTVNTPGATVAGGGTFHVLARYNGTAWIVVA